MRSMSSAALAAMSGTYTDEVFLFVLDVEVDGEEYRFVDDTVPLTRNNKTYYPLAFNIVLPSEGDDVQAATLSIDAVDQEIIKVMRGAVGVPTVAFSLILSSDANGIPEAGPFNFEVKEIAYNHLTLEATLAYGLHLDGAFPKYFTDPIDFPGLY